MYKKMYKTGVKKLECLCKRGIAERYSEVTEALRSRLMHEIDTINRKGFVGGFLIVYDLIRFAKKHNLMVSPGVGALPGSLVSYCLGITRVDPIKEDLIFERYLNIERAMDSYGIRIDVAKGETQVFKDYISEKHG